MSSTLKTSTALSAAVKYNAKTRLDIPPAALERHPELAADRASAQFALAVADVQFELLLEADGFFGPATQQALTHATMPRADFLVVGGQRLMIDTKGLFSVVDFTENPAFDLHKYGHFSRRKKPVSRVILHHGGYNIEHLASALSTTERKVSTHIGLDIDRQGAVRVAQYLDLHHCAWHAGRMNEGSVGIDFAMQPGVEHQGRYGFPVVDNSSTIGPKKVLEFPDAALRGMGQLVKELHRLFNINGGNPIMMDGAETRYDETAHARISVMGHHHFATNGKFDVSYLWDRFTTLNNPANVRT